LIDRLCVVASKRGKKVYHDIISVELLGQARRGDWGPYKHAVQAVTKDGVSWLYLYEGATHAREDFAEWRETEFPKSIVLTVNGERRAQ
jgi:hypothetical protein